MRKNYLKLFGLSLVAMMFISTKTNAQVYVIGSGEYATSVSNDGNVVVLYTDADNYYWTKKDGIQQLGSIVPGTYNGGVSTVTANGKLIATNVMNPDTGINQTATYNLETKKWKYLGGFGIVSDSETSSVWGMNGDGSTIVGLANTKGGAGHAVKWINDEIIDLGSTVNTRASRANSTSEDGRIIAGWQDDSYGTRMGAYWKDGVQHIIKDADGYEVGEIASVSGNGKWLLGTSAEYAMRWSEETGVLPIKHPNADPFFVGAATATNNDGSMIVGFYRSYPGHALMGEGFIWTEKTGRVELNEYVKSLGYDDLGITFALPYAISKDGSQIVGIGRTDTQEVSFLISLPKLSTSEVNKTNYTIYPNPATDVINIETKGTLSTSILYNMAGQKVLASDQKQISISSLPKGTYILKTIIDGNENTKKIIKK